MVRVPSPPSPTQTALPKSLWGTWLISALLLTIVGGGMILLPSVARAYWPWALTPFNTILLGLIYATAAVPLIGYLRHPRLNYLRILLPTFTCFTTYFFLVSVGFTDTFSPRKASSIWFFLYGADSFVGLYFCWRLWRHFRQVRTNWAFALLYRVQSLLLMGLGLGLLLMPKVMGSLWAWPIDGFHARLYSGVLITSALASELLRRWATPVERTWFAVVQISLGLLTLALTVFVDLQVGKLSWVSLSLWMWLIAFLVFGGGGAWIFMSERWGRGDEN